MAKPLCPACLTRFQKGDVHPDYKCAFDEKGQFTPENWNCATLIALGEKAEKVYGNDQTVDLISSPDETGMIALSRYKQRGSVCQAVILDVNKGPVKILDHETALAFLPKSAS